MKNHDGGGWLDNPILLHRDSGLETCSSFHDIKEVSRVGLCMYRKWDNDFTNMKPKHNIKSF